MNVAQSRDRGALDGELTILLTLKDRVPYTLRWMTYANATAFPFKVLIADGGDDDGAEAMLADRSRFPNLDYAYVRFPVDRTYSDYYAKMAAALALVRTPFVAMADNDDFFVVESLREAIGFLAANAGHVACGGQGAIFWMHPGSKGGAMQWKCTRETDSVDADSASERLRAVSLSKSDTFYYDVKRTAEARSQFEIVRDLDMKDLFLVEHLVWHLTAIAGRTKRLERLYLARQQDSPGSSGATHQQVHGDWVGRMLVESWSADFGKFLQTTATRLAQADNLTLEEARRVILGSYRASVAPSLLSDILNEPTVSLSMSCVVPVVRKLVGLPEASLLRRFARALYRRFGWISLDIVYGTELVASPVPGIQRDIQPIRDFLERPG